jgi:hypothetical protein
MKMKLLAVVAASALLVVACDDDSEPTPDPALAFCDSAASLAAAVVSFRQLDAQDTIADIQTSAEAVEAAFQAFETSAGDLAESQVETIQDAAGELRSAIDAIPDTDTVDQALASLTPQVAALREAINEAGETNCARVLIEAKAETDAEAAQEAEATMEAEAEEAASDAEAAAEEAVGDAEATAEAEADEAEEVVGDAEEAVDDAASDAETAVEQDVSEAETSAEEAEATMEADAQAAEEAVESMAPEESDG